MSHYCKLRHRKKILKTFENSFLKNGILKFWSKPLIVYILQYSSNNNYVHNQNIISYKLLITNFPEKIRKLSLNKFYFLR